MVVGMSDRDGVGERLYQFELLFDLVVYGLSVLAGLAGMATGHPELLVVPAVVYVTIAVNPNYGRFRHVRN